MQHDRPATSHSTLATIRDILAGLGLTFYGLAPCADGPGLVVPWTNQFSVVSVADRDPTIVNLARGIAKDVEPEPGELTRICHSHNTDRPDQPVVVHRSDEGWDLLSIHRVDVGELVAAPELARRFLGDSSDVVDVLHRGMAKAGLGFDRFTWSPDDLRRLLVRSFD